MGFEHLPQNREQKELVVTSRQKHPELWTLIDEGNRKKLADDSSEMVLLAEEIRDYLHGNSTPEFEYYETSGQKENKVTSLRELIKEFFSAPSQRNARKIGDFFW